MRKETADKRKGSRSIPLPHSFPEKHAMPVRLLTFDEVIDALLALKKPHFSGYLAMYSSWYGGIITDPALMMAPLDDHLVHRGDGIFEVFKCTGWNIYALDRHLDRIEAAAKTFGIEIPLERPRLAEITQKTILAGNSGTCLTRLFVSRGPGSFCANPYESIGSQVYIMVTEFEPPAREKYERGVKLATSAIPVKPGYFATAKNCNYLPNVLMKKEALDAGADFPVSVDERGYLAEGASENVGIITRGGDFLIPRFSRVLRGITVSRAVELARSLLGGGLSSVAEADISREQAREAAEMLVFGTSFDILPVVEYDGNRIGNGRPGPGYKKLLGLLLEDQKKNARMLTPVRTSPA